MPASPRMAATLLLAAALASGPWAPSASAAPYHLDLGDSVTVSVRDYPRYSGTFSVRPDGMLSMPHFTELDIRGKTVDDVRAHIVSLLTRQIHDLDVSVTVGTYRPRIVTVIGEVQSPGNITLGRPDQGVLDTIAAAGGFTLRALPAQVVVMRGTGKQMQRIPVNIEAMLATGDMHLDVRLEPGDRVQVARNPWPSFQEAFNVANQVIAYLGTLSLLLMFLQRFSGTAP